MTGLNSPVPGSAGQGVPKRAIVKADEGVHGAAMPAQQQRRVGANVRKPPSDVRRSVAGENRRSFGGRAWLEPESSRWGGAGRSSVLLQVLSHQTAIHCSHGLCQSRVF